MTDKTDKEDYNKVANYLIDKYKMTEVGEFIEKNDAFEQAVKIDKEYFETKGIAKYTVLDSMKLDGYKQVAVDAGRKLYKKLVEMKPYERKIIVSHYLRSKGVRDADQLLDGDEGDLESAVKKSLSEYDVSKKPKQPSSSGLGDEDFWWEDSEDFDD